MTNIEGYNLLFRLCAQKSNHYIERETFHMNIRFFIHDDEIDALVRECKEYSILWGSTDEVTRESIECYSSETYCLGLNIKIALDGRQNRLYYTRFSRKELKGNYARKYASSFSELMYNRVQTIDL